jgi:hypothetical protein
VKITLFASRMPLTPGAGVRHDALPSRPSESEAQIMGKLQAKFPYLRLETIGDFVSTPGDFSSAIKNAKLRKAGMGKLDYCEICEAPIHPNALSHDHEKDKSEGGSASVENDAFVHPFCNSSKKELLGILRNPDPQAWRSVPTPKFLAALIEPPSESLNALSETP